MSDTPYPELVDRLVSQVLRVVYGAVDHSPTERILRERLERDMPYILAALAEWADGGFIAPSTWTVVEAERETGWCVYWGHGPDCECNDGARWVLSPRESER